MTTYPFRSLIFATSLLTILPPVYADTAAGSMACKVTKQRIIETTDGKAAEYSGWEGGFKEGDILLLKYAALSQSIASDGPNLTIQLRDERTDEPVHVVLSSLTKKSPDNRIYTHVSKDIIWAENDIGRLVLKRYYKSDWEGLFVSTPNAIGLASQIFAMDCRTKIDRIEEVLKILQK